MRQNNFVQRMPEVAAVQVKVLLRQGNITAAADLAGQYELPLIRARVLLAQGDPSAALAVLGPLRQQMEAQGLAFDLLYIKLVRSQSEPIQEERKEAAKGEAEGQIRR